MPSRTLEPLHSPFQRWMSRLLIVTVTSLVLQPLSAAAQAQPAQASNRPAKHHHVEDIEDAVQDVVPEAWPGRKRHRQADDDDRAVAAQKLLENLDVVETEADEVETEFGQTESDLSARNLPPEILARHRQAVADFQARRAEFRRHAQAIERAAGGRQNFLSRAVGKKPQADNPLALKTALEDLAAFLAKHPNKRAHTSTDPTKLPWGSPKPVTREPYTDRTQFQLSGLFPHETVKLAAAGTIQGIALPTPAGPLPTAADLAETEDVQLTPEIRAQAQALGNNPVKIHNWVRNTIEFIPSYGSIQGAAMTMQTKRGNAFDTASLEIALLRAANIPARYVYGTVEVPIAQVMNWVGGVTKPEAAQSLLGQGGIPNVAVVSGGVVNSMRMEHVWVEAWVDYLPSRGARHVTGDTWVPLDASFKQYQYKAGMDLQTQVPLDAQVLLTQAQQGATVNETQGWVQNLNQTNLQTALTDYQARITAYIDRTKPTATIGDVLGMKTIQAENGPILLGSLPYKTIATGSRFAVMPANLQHQVRFDFYASAFDRTMDSPAFSYAPSLPQLTSKKVAFVYEPATPADQTVLDNAVENYQVSVPAYLVHVRPTLRVEGTVVATGPVVAMGERQVMSVAAVAPWYQNPRDYALTAGDLSVFGINPAGITPEVFNARTSQHDLSTGAEPDYTAEMFHQILLGWWGEKHALNDIAATSRGVVQYQMPSHALAGAPVSVRYFFGIARSASYKSRVMDAKEDRVVAVSLDDQNEPRRQFILTAGHIGSYLEGGIFEQAFLAEQPYGISTVALANSANIQGMKIFTVTSDNIAAILPQLTTSAEVKDDVENAVLAGKRVTIPQRDVTHYGYSGIGYLIEDPDTGEAAYLIDGGRAGGGAGAGEYVYPMPQPVATPLHNLVLSSSLRQGSAGLAKDNKGLVMGVALTAVAPVVGAAAPKNPYVLAAAAVIAALIIYSSNKNQIEQRYPKIGRVFRHFTRSIYVALIDGTKLILGSKPGGTYNPDFRAVYVADANDPQAQASCPLTPDESSRITNDYELPNPAEAFVEIEITRAGYWDAVLTANGPNGHGTTEWMFRLPFLYYGPYAVAIQEHRPACY